jgi:transcriptional regulator with XRE-family HTH domain
MSRFPSMADRAWFAYQCLPKTETGAPPPLRELERANDLSNAMLRKLIRGISKRPSYVELVKMARALNCTPEWLQSEIGDGPVARWPIPVRPTFKASPSLPNGITARAHKTFERDTKKLLESPVSAGRKHARK